MARNRESVAPAPRPRCPVDPVEEAPVVFAVRGGGFGFWGWKMGGKQITIVFIVI
jgi:hypothetical protein